MKSKRATKLKRPPCSAAILDYPSKPGWWWAWYKSAAQWYLINISHDDLDEENVPPNYECWTECVPPLPPNNRAKGRKHEPEIKPMNEQQPAMVATAEDKPGCAYAALVDDLTIIRDKIESLRQFTAGERDVKGGILDAQLWRARCVIEDAMATAA